MSEYICERCGFNTPYRITLKRHLKRKYSCDAKIKNVSTSYLYTKLFNKNSDFKTSNSMKKVIKSNHKCNHKCNHERNHFETNCICRYCEKGFSSRQCRWRHEQKCKIRDNCDPDEVSQLKQRIVDLQQEVKSIKNYDKITVKQLEFNKLSSDVLSENINKDTDKKKIKRKAYKKTDYSHLKDSDYLEAIKRGNMGIPGIVEKIHFNPEKRDNNNIYITNLKSDYMQVYNGTEWEAQLTEDFLNFLVQDNADRIEDKIEEWHDTNHKYSGEDYEDLLDKYPRFLDRLSKTEYVNSKVRKEVKLILFNKRNLSKLPCDQKLNKNVMKRFKLENKNRQVIKYCQGDNSIIDMKNVDINKLKLGKRGRLNNIDIKVSDTDSKINNNLSDEFIEFPFYSSEEADNQ